MPTIRTRAYGRTSARRAREPVPTPTSPSANSWEPRRWRPTTPLGSATIQNGDYNLALAAIPSGQDTMLVAGANDLWKCNLATDCVWRNTTNAASCMKAQVAGYQHALAWNLSSPQEIFIGNDGGLWRSTDGIGETGEVCSSSDSSHFQNLNGSLGSLAEVDSMSQVGSSPYTMMVGLGVNGTAGVKSATGPTAEWPQVLSGEGGPVAIDSSHPANWYINNGVGASIHVCSQDGPCKPADFGSAPVVSNADVNGDGKTMTSPAPFLVDPVDASQLLIATCRLWRGPATGGWTTANAVAPIFDGNITESYCSGNALVRSMAAIALPGGGEIVYVGTYSSLNGGGTAGGHVLSVTMNAAGTWSGWHDLTLNPVTNDQFAMNSAGFDISSIFIDPHDQTGNTIYATVAGVSNHIQTVRVVYRSTDGGAHWSCIQSNLPNDWAPANSIVVDPLGANTVYLATDSGVYITQTVTTCGTAPSACWSAYGTGLPLSPVVALSAAPATTSPSVLVAGTFGRGVWQIPLATAGVQPTTATVDPTSADFGTQAEGSASAVRKTVTVTNTGGVALTPTLVALGGANPADFVIASDGCSENQINSGALCVIELAFSPSALGDREATLTISANVSGGQLPAVSLKGTGAAAGSITLNPTTLNFDVLLPGKTQVGTTSRALPVSVNNGGGVPVAIASITTPPPFAIASNTCGNSISAGNSCNLTVTFSPTQRGPATQNLTIADDAGTQTVILSGTGGSPPTDTLSVNSLTFADTVIGKNSPPLTVTLANNGDAPLTSVSAAVSGPFQISANPCTQMLAANSSCAISVIFTPTQTGPQSGTLTIADILRSTPQTVALNGTGLLPPASDVVQIVPAQVSFPATGVGTPSSPVTLTIVNANSGPVLTDLKLSVSSGFQLANSTCGNTLAVGANCTVGVSFVPAGIGAQDGTFSVSSSALSSAMTAHLTGTGFDFGVTISGASTQTVSSGQTASYALTLTPLGGSSATFTFKCGTIPTYAACVLNPSSETVSSGATGTEGIQITTGQSSSASVQSVERHGAGGWRAWPVTLAFLALPALWRRRRGLFLVGCALVLVAAGVSGCSSSGGGTGGTPPPPATHTTPAGTYSIPVTVTSSGVSHAVTLTLVVD